MTLLLRIVQQTSESQHDTMPFQAIVDGESIISLHIDPKAWRTLSARSRAGEDIVRMACCNGKGILKISPRGRQFFAHKSQPAECCWKPESPEHLELKAVVHDTVTGIEEWYAEMEASGPDWRADVLATRGKARIAFEVQLSGQGQRMTEFREVRYEATTVLPWWIVTSRRNAGEGFGSSLRSVVQGRDLSALAQSTRRAVLEVLRRVESQVRISESVLRYLREKQVRFELVKFCGIPTTFVVELEHGNGNGRQYIVIGELGADAVPDIEQLCADSAGNPWGSVVQFVRYSPQIRGFGSTAFYLKHNPAKELSRLLDKLFGGDLVWRGRKHSDYIEAALVWYRETCRNCHQAFARSPFAVAGHLFERPDVEPKLAAFQMERSRSWAQAVVEQFENREGLRLGLRWHSPANSAHSVATQNCPHCGYTQTDSLITAEQALTCWPYEVADWEFKVHPKNGQWAPPIAPAPRRRSSVAAWEGLLRQARDERDRAEEEMRRQKQEQERQWAVRRQEKQRRLEEEAAKAEAARVEAERLRLEREQLWRAAELRIRKSEQEAEADRRQKQLRAVAVSKFGRKDLADLWMQSHQPRIGAKPIEYCVIDFDACVALLPVKRRR